MVVDTTGYKVKAGADSIKHFVTADGNILFAAFKPLGFNSGKALAEKVGQGVATTNRVIEKLEPFVDRILNRVKSQVNLKNLDESVFDNIKTNAAGNYVIVIPKGTTLVAGTVTDRDVEIEIDDIIAPMKSSFASVNDMIDSFKNVMAKINGTNFGNWLEKFTNKFNNVFANNAQQMLEPVLLAIDKDGNVSRVSGIESAPYEAKANVELTLDPTSYSAEIFAPAYAKYIACEDITAPGFNEVLFANDVDLKFTPEAGKTYKVVYEAVDFTGVTRSHTYYILGK